MKKTIILIVVCLIIAFSFTLVIARDTGEQPGVKKILYFTAGAWCPPCKVMDVTVEKVQSELSKDIVIEVINCDNQRDAAMKHKVTGVPTLIFLKDEKKVDHIVGAVKAEKIMEKIESVFDEAERTHRVKQSIMQSR